jgi:hypothetical protein
MRAMGTHGILPLTLTGEGSQHGPEAKPAEWLCQDIYHLHKIRRAPRRLSSG